MPLLVIGVCSSLCLNAALGVVATLRLLPALVSLARYLTRLLFVCSFRLYRLILTLLAPYAKRYAQLELTTGRVRLAASVILSLVLALTVLLVLQVQLSLWTVGPAALHGLIVGLLWDDLAQSGELQLGVKLS